MPFSNKHSSRYTLLKALFFLTGLWLVTACSAPQQEARKVQIMAMGTLVDIAIWGENEKKAQQAIDDISRIMNDTDQTWHAWKPSALTQINATLQQGKPARLNNKLFPLFKQSLQLSRKSHGFFDPAVGSLSRLWSFQQDNAPQGPPPDDKKIKTLLHTMATARDLVLHDHLLSSSNAHINLDLGAIAKGYAVDQGIERLKKLGIKHAIINAGGDLRAIGTHGPRRWRIGIRDPRSKDPGGILASIETSGDESIFTSGDYERYFIYKGVRYHHILNPKTGYPSTDLTSVTVIHDNATEADAIATALMVAGRQHWQKVARSMHADTLMLIDTEDRVTLTPTMKKRVHFLKDIHAIQTVSP